ncbi:hypothetical protein ACFYPC_08785 [Streptomyces sp. NPDC005808]|uniref:hypothetical protein n=1 Tax=Streptomyces sp. NPDC005808 TaxID=3364734 RepID=UPI00368E36FA
MVFPQTPLDVRIDLQINGIWTDVTSDVYTAEKITITRGRSDEGVRADPGKCSLTFNNRLGKYSPRNPLSPYYQLIGRNTPLRVSVRAGSPFLSLTGVVADFASTPDAAVLDLTGDLDLRWEGEADWYADGAQTLIGKWEATGGQKAYMLRLEDRALIIHQSTDGTGGAFFGRTLPPLPRRAALRATLDVDNGAGGKTARFYWARSIAGPWTEFADPVTLASTLPTFASTAPLKVAPADLTAVIPRYPVAGRAYKAEVRNGIAGTVVANPDFTAQAVGATSFVDGAGRTWSMNGAAAVTNRRVRFIGEVSSWPSRWDVSGKDIRVPVEAAGILRRLGQGQQALQSTLRRRIPSGAPLAYWPLEEGRDATQFYSPTAGVRPLRTAGFDLAADDSLAGSNALPAVQEGATLIGTVPAPSGSPTQWHTEFVFNLPNAGPASARTVLQWTGTGTVKRWRLMLRTGVSEIYGYDDDDVVVTSALVNLTGLGVFNTWSRWQLYAVQNGGNVDWTVRWIPIGGQGGQVTTSYAGTVGRISGVLGVTGGYNSDLNGLRLGHIAAFTTANTTIYNSADLGFAGETAGVRMMRLREEEAVPLVINGVVSRMEEVGAQRPDTLLTLLEESASVDGGILGERREDIALAYRDRISLYNQAVTLALDYLTPGHVAPPLEPVDDDQKVRNDVTVTREGGSSERAVLESGPLSVQAPPDGVGVYDEAVTLNLYADEQAEQHAGWRLHLGTVDEARYPVLNVDLAAAPSLIDAVTDVDSGDRVQIAHPPAHLPPDTIDLLAQGYTEVLGHPIDWDMQFNCTPALPWNVWELGAADYNRLKSSGSTLAASATSTATALSVASAGLPWTTAPAALPFRIRVGGEVMTVTAITGTTSPQAFTVTRSVNGVVKAQSSGAGVQLEHPAVVPL